MYFPPVEASRVGSGRRGVAVAGVVALHVVLVALLGYAAVRPEVSQPVRAMAVRMLEPVVSAPAPKPEPVKPPPSTPKVPLTPPPVVAVPKRAEAPASFAVPAQAAPVSAPSTPAPAAVPAPVTAARFDADYLQNPRPVYPPMSRRLGEEGKVVLRVRVSAQGQPISVEIGQSSGYARLDDAARTAVERWRFVPARQGNEAIDSSVLVPLNFTLSN